MTLQKRIVGMTHVPVPQMFVADNPTTKNDRVI